MIVRKTIRLEDDVIKKLEVKHGDFKTGITIAAEKEVGIIPTKEELEEHTKVISGLPQKPINSLKEALTVMPSLTPEEINRDIDYPNQKECTIEASKPDKYKGISVGPPVYMGDFSLSVISKHQLNILSWMFPSTKKDSVELINELLDHLIPDTSKTNAQPYDEDGKLIKKFESKTPLPEDCAQWKKNLRAMQCVDKMMDLQKTPPPPPSTKGRK